MMRRIRLNARNSRAPLNTEGVSDWRFADVVHWCGTIKEAAISGDFPSSDLSATKDGAFRFQRNRKILFQRQRNNERLDVPPLRPQHQFQIRHFVFDSRKSRKAKATKDPFKVLKIPKESQYKDVKAKFLRIAMDNHPDMHTDGLSEKEQEAMRDRFIEARMAFERLEEDPSDGKAVLTEELVDRDENFNSWFRNETGLKNPFDLNIDPEIMKEVAEMTEKMGGKQGMERDGGSKY